ncbi:MAG: choice-of-anchor Q domain-containing protein, partial [Limisphaerales bacterium]
GGCYSNILNNCLLIYNSAGGDGIAAADGCCLTNCTLVYNRNRIDSDADDIVQFSTLRNCILYYNDENKYEYGDGNFQYCCLDPGMNYTYSFNFPLCISNAPSFVNLTNDFHLQSNSPCINAGANSFVASASDLDGNPRVAGGTVDIGAYEYQSPASVISYAYLDQYGLPIDGSVDFADLDGTAFNVYQDWIADLNPTNPASVLAMLASAATNNPAGVRVSWQSVSGISYNLERSTNLLAIPTFVTITNITGQAGATSFQDTTATRQEPYFYRVSVVAPYGQR